MLFLKSLWKRTQEQLKRFFSQGFRSYRLLPIEKLVYKLRFPGISRIVRFYTKAGRGDAPKSIPVKSRDVLHDWHYAHGFKCMPREICIHDEPITRKIAVILGSV